VEKKKVLLADDIELFLELEKTFFRRENFELLTARTGPKAFEIINEQRPDLVFMDLYMPELDGDECCRRVKADPQLRTTPIVIVTTMGDAQAQERCRACGCDEVLLKPINRHLFTETARRFLSVPSRVEPRIPARLEVTYGAGQQALSDFSVNISTGGLFLETATPLPIATDLQLVFTLPVRAQPIRCKGRVAWVNHVEMPVKPGFPSGIGVQMLDLSLDDMHAIRDFMKEQCLSASW
jgi:uncharacterized protein (TIGR02266 family)